jgi:hypothetical protein
MMTKETIYIDAVTKLNQQDAVIEELAELLERVLFAWSMGRPLSEENDLYMDAHYYLKGLRDE